jgi:hypothetical protein
MYVIKMGKPTSDFICNFFVAMRKITEIMECYCHGTKAVSDPSEPSELVFQADPKMKIFRVEGMGSFQQRSEVQSLRLILIHLDLFQCPGLLPVQRRRRYLYVF